MTTYIALLRGINVGGKNKLPMKELRAVLEGLGASDVRTYIQSGNVVMQHGETETRALEVSISSAIEAAHGFAPRTLVLTAADLRQAAEANPFPEAIDEPKTLHLSFLATPSESPDLAKLEEVAKASERFHLGDGCFYLHAPEGIGRSKLAERVERVLGVPATARNWRTVSKLLEMIG